jgi:hypothetical protein
MARTDSNTDAEAADDDSIDPKDVRLKHFKRLLPLLARLHDVGTARDKAGNRELFFDDYAAMVVLFLLSPLISSMRALLRACRLPKVKQKLGLKRVSAGSFSEAPQVFAPDKLKSIVDELAAGAKPLLEAHRLSNNPALADLKHALTLVDGTVLRGLTRLNQIALDNATGQAHGGSRFGKGRDGRIICGWRLHTQLELGSFIPSRVDVTGARNGGEARETNVLRRTLEKDRCYVIDTGYLERNLLDDIVSAGSSYVCRMRENCVYEVQEERPISSEAAAAGVISDQVVRWDHEDGRPMNHALRIVTVKVAPHPRRTRTGEKSRRETDIVVIVTCLLDLPAELIALIYQCRYSVELFFRFFKHLLGMRHLLSQHKNGVEIQTYCAIIACLLTSLWSGKKPDKAMMELINWYLLGLADEDDVLRELNKPDRRGTKLAAKEALWKKLGL